MGKESSTASTPYTVRGIVFDKHYFNDICRAEASLQYLWRAAGCHCRWSGLPNQLPELHSHFCSIDHPSTGCTHPHNLSKRSPDLPRSHADTNFVHDMLERPLINLLHYTPPLSSKYMPVKLCLRDGFWWGYHDCLNCMFLESTSDCLNCISFIYLKPYLHQILFCHRHLETVLVRRCQRALIQVSKIQRSQA